MIGNQRILASAGSGKTFALTDRIIRLLALGADPGRIVALTFTRKASGEFLDRLVEKLAEASLSEEKAAALATRVGAKGRGADYFRELLAGVIARLDRLPFGTLDGFLAGIVSCFPRELHLRGEVKVMDASTEKAQGRRVLTEVSVASPPTAELLPVLMDVFFREEVRFGRTIGDLPARTICRAGPRALSRVPRCAPLGPAVSHLARRQILAHAGIREGGGARYPRAGDGSTPRSTNGLWWRGLGSSKRWRTSPRRPR